MTTTETKMFSEGREMMQAMHHMLKGSGKSCGFPTQEDIRKLARQLDLKYSYVSARIWTFLGN